MSLLVVMAYERNPGDVTSAIKELVGNGDHLDQCWAGTGSQYFYEKRDYPTLLPSRPRIVDPANPTNNVWVSGLKRYKKGEWISDYGNRAIIKSRIHSIDLEKGPTMMDRAKAAMDTIVKTLHEAQQKDVGLVVSEVVKAGSLGHGTAVPGHYDLDIVLYSDSLDGNKIAEDGFDHWIDTVQQFLDKNIGDNITRTTHSSHFKYNGETDVDMFVSPFWREPSDLYQFLQGIPEEDRFTFAMSASKWQVKFFSHQPNQAKEFIKRAKAWRNRKWEGGHEGRPKSYLLSVIVLRAHETARTMGDTSTQGIAKNTTEEVTKIVRNHQRADIFWEEYYRCSHPLFPPNLPRIVDPANPANNLHATGISGPGNTRGNDYGEGGGKWSNFVMCVDTLDLTMTVEEIQSSSLTALSDAV